MGKLTQLALFNCLCSVNYGIVDGFVGISRNSNLEITSTCVQRTSLTEQKTTWKCVSGSWWGTKFEHRCLRLISLGSNWFNFTEKLIWCSDCNWVLSKLYILCKWCAPWWLSICQAAPFTIHSVHSKTILVFLWVSPAILFNFINTLLELLSDSFWLR